MSSVASVGMPSEVLLAGDGASLGVPPSSQSGMSAAGSQTHVQGAFRCWSGHSHAVIHSTTWW